MGITVVCVTAAETQPIGNSAPMTDNDTGQRITARRLLSPPLAASFDGLVAGAQRQAGQLCRSYHNHSTDTAELDIVS